MIRRAIALMLMIPLVWLAGATAADDAKADDDGPVRLKRKKRATEEQPAPDKKDEKKAEAKDGKKPEVPPPDKAEEPDPPAPEEDEQEILARLTRNLNALEDRLANKELGDDTRQVQRDVLKDLEALVNKSEQGGGGGGGGGENDQSQNDQSGMGGGGGSSGGSSSKGGGSSGGMSGKQGGASGGGGQSGSKSTGRRERQEARNKQNGGGSGKQGGTQVAGGNPGSGNPGQGNPGQGKPGAGGKDNPGGGNNPGAGGKDNPGKKDRASDVYKDVWGHLPESLRADMNAYSNEKEFMARYEELIIKYYKTIAEQGRRKGE